MVVANNGIMEYRKMILACSHVTFLLTIKSESLFSPCHFNHNRKLTDQLFITTIKAY